MPRRQPAKEVPRWRRGKTSPAPQIRLSPKQERQLVERVAATAALQGQVIGHSAPQGQMAGAIATTGTYRFRYQLVPFAWLAGVAITGLCARAPHTTHAAAIGILLGLAATAAMILLTRHLPQCPEKGKEHQRCFTRHAWQAMAALTALWVPALSLGAGSWHPVLFLGLMCWVCVLVPWVRHYRIRAGVPPQADPSPPSDYVKWNLLAAEKKWNATLGPAEALPGGGRRYPVHTDGIKTVIGNVLSASENIAGAWHKPMTEAYAERSPDGITSRGYLTVLGGDTLMRVRKWNGAGADLETGLAVVGRYADGSAAHMKFFTRRYGTRHALISGTTGAGKSALLDLLIFIAIECGIIVPVVLDPQEGQSLPYWRDRCLYAAGPGECLNMLRGLHAGMLDRSRYLSGLRWDDDGVPMRGMGFFDHVLTGLPIVLIIFDEAHMLLTQSVQNKENTKAAEYALEIGRLGRKTGTALWLGTHLPGLSELGGQQALRDMLRGGNVLSFRTANAVAAGMLGLQKDPSLIPQYFTDGTETAGLSLLAGPDNRPDAPMRTDLVPKTVKRRNPVVPALDERFAEAMDRAMRMGGVQVTLPAPAPAPALTVAPSPAGDDAPPGRTTADAILAVLDEAPGELDRGEIVKRSGELVTTRWAREKPFSVRAHTDALRDLAEAGRITKVRHGTYAPVRPSLHVVGASATSASPGGTG